MQLILNLQDMMFFMSLPPGLHSVFLCQRACRFAAFLAIRGSQFETQTTLFNFKGQTALFVIVGLFARVGILCRILCQPVLEIGVMGLNFNNAALFVKEDMGGFLTLGKSCFHNSSFLEK